MIYKVASSQALKFVLYERIQNMTKQTLGNNYLSVLASSTMSGCIIMSLTYPLDLVHGRMAADMSKKPSMYSNKANPTSQSIHKDRLYTSVRDCLNKTQ